MQWCLFSTISENTWNKVKKSIIVREEEKTLISALRTFRCLLPELTFLRRDYVEEALGYVSTVVLPEIYEPSFCEMIPDMLHFAKNFLLEVLVLLYPVEILSMISVGRVSRTYSSNWVSIII